MGRCVAEWFGRMQSTGEIPKDNPEAVDVALKETQTRVFQALQRNELVYGQLLASDHEHATKAGAGELFP